MGSFVEIQATTETKIRTLANAIPPLGISTDWGESLRLLWGLRSLPPPPLLPPPPPPPPPPHPSSKWPFPPKTQFQVIAIPLRQRHHSYFKAEKLISRVVFISDLFAVGGRSEDDCVSVTTEEWLVSLVSVTDSEERSGQSMQQTGGSSWPFIPVASHHHHRNHSTEQNKREENLWRSVFLSRLNINHTDCGGLFALLPSMSLPAVAADHQALVDDLSFHRIIDFKALSLVHSSHKSLPKASSFSWRWSSFLSMQLL